MNHPVPQHDPAAHLAALVESSEDAIISKRLDGTVLTWNPAAQRIFGYEASEMVGRSIRTLLAPDRQHEEDEILAGVSRGDRLASFLTKRLHKDGSVVDVSMTVSPIRDATGHIVAASTIVRDAGPFLLEQAAKAQAEERLRMVADNIAQLAWTADATGWINWYNKRWYDYTGTTFAEMEGWGWQNVHHPDHLEGVTERFRAAINAGEYWEDTFPLRGRDGEFRWFLSRALPIRDSEGRIHSWFGSNTDVTDLLEKEEQIRLLLMEVNHRSKNMLAVVQSLLRRSATGDGNFVERFSRRLASLAANQDLLTRRGWTAIPIGELVQAQLGFLSRNASAQITSVGPDFKISPRAAETLGMALHELATNALKYGALSVTEGDVSVRWTVEDGNFVLEWEESGGPPAHAPDATGFGTTLIRDVPARTLRADVSLDYSPTGLKWRLQTTEAGVASGLDE